MVRDTFPLRGPICNAAMLTDFTQFTDAETRRWLWLRAIEWCGWPAFVSQLVAPPLLIYFNWYLAWIGLLIVDLAWQLLIHVFVSPWLAHFSCISVVWFKWPVTICSGVYLCIQGRYLIGLLALCWPLLCSFLTIPSRAVMEALGLRRHFGDIELQFAKRIGYVPQDAELSPLEKGRSSF